MGRKQLAGKQMVAGLLMMASFSLWQEKMAVADDTPASTKASSTIVGQADIADDGRWLAGDLHNHTFFTDGNHTPDQVLSHAFQFGLAWIVNSEHGGAFHRNASGQPWPANTLFLGDPPTGKMWRWQSLWHYSYPQIVRARAHWPGKMVMQGYEWNVPEHDHASVAIVGTAEEGGLAIARHAYLFDDKDNGATAEDYLGLESKGTGKTAGKMMKNNHDKAVAGVTWLQRHYPQNSYFIVNHPSRWQNYSIAALRDFHEAAPDVAFGFEGMPGHQKATSRGHYNGGPFTDAAGQDITFRARTYGGADYMLAKVGGVWDALLGEGRRFFVFVNSDFHSPEHDFWPGEYAKDHILVRDLDQDGQYEPEELVAGLRSGHSFIAHGDLVDGLHFSLQCQQAPEITAQMGDTLSVVDGCLPQFRISFRSPASNNGGNSPVVDHVDLIMGEVRGRIGKTIGAGKTPNPEYDQELNPSARVVATFTDKDWKEDISGTDGQVWRTVTFSLPSLKGDSYYRLRGTSVGRGVAGETDEAGNPLNDELQGSNNADKAYADLWFYSNPIILHSKR